MAVVTEYTVENAVFYGKMVRSQNTKLFLRTNCNLETTNKQTKKEKVSKEIVTKETSLSPCYNYDEFKF